VNCCHVLPWRMVVFRKMAADTGSAILASILGRYVQGLHWGLANHDMGWWDFLVSGRVLINI
jgi:hypothetical protein